jgi:hypothetical protein
MTEPQTVRSFLERDHARLDQLLVRAGFDASMLDA